MVSKSIGLEVAAMTKQPSSGRPPVADSRRLAEMVTNDFYDGQLDLSARGMGRNDAWAQMPEVECVKEIRRDPQITDRDVRLFLTFIMAMDRARDAVRLWHAGANLFQEHPQVFDPTYVSGISPTILGARLSESGVSQRHGPDTEAWRRIGQSLATGGGAVCRVIDEGVGDAKQLLRELQTRDRAGRPRFPMLRGPKVGPVWIRILASPGGAQIDRIHTIPVAVDVHVRRVTENLKVTNTQGVELSKGKPEIQSAWREAVSTAKIDGPAGITGTCAALDPALWFFGKYGCSYCEKERRRVPIGSACNHCQLDSPIAAQASKPRRDSKRLMSNSRRRKYIKSRATRPDAESDHVALAEYRASIDNIDASLIFLMAERFKITEKVGNYKRDHGLRAASPDREQEQFRRMEKLAAEAGVDQEFMGKFLRFIIDEVIRRHERIKER